MISTVLVEPYTFPKIVPISVTILRGARRMRFSRTLRPRYADFAPRLWLFLQRLGYKKFLQRIYIDLDVDKPVTHQYYEFPILLEVLRKLGVLNQIDAVTTLGKIRTSEEIELPPWFSSDLVPYAITAPTTFYMPTTGTQLVQELNRLQQKGSTRISPIKATAADIRKSILSLASTQRSFQEARILQNTFIYPGIAIENNAISLCKTSYTYLNKLDISSIRAFSFIWTNPHSAPSGLLFDWLCKNKPFLSLTIYAKQSNDNLTLYEKYSPLCDYIQTERTTKPINYLLENLSL